ncbi:VOC family protein [Phytohabitans houttuyneae]|uniref:Glyoxalase n=1 Tax=Phytohabitans houttuyneae TaxID=1076126 RepID=A0A6V8KQP1_9ACTN|nr:VOC family protein [Phytohabitans houttuyneae]GFJ84097.1 glyoxalase [Phytohabitans houttuyneae]
MLSDCTPIATLPTADVARARKFYEGTLGLTPLQEAAGGIMYRCGEGKLFVYESEYAGTNKATAVSFSVTDKQFDEEIDQLRKKGVTFLTFEYEGMEWKDDVMVSEEMRAVWFSDPDGNVLNVGTEM